MVEHADTPELLANALRADGRVSQLRSTIVIRDMEALRRQAQGLI